MYSKIAAAVLIAVTVSGCAGLQKKIDFATGVYETVTTTTVPADVVIPAANTFDILKAGATNYGRYCIAQKDTTGSWPGICAAEFRRGVIKAVRAGTAARNQLESSVETGQPAAASIYNVLVSAVTSLKASPAANQQFVGAVQ